MATICPERELKERNGESASQEQPLTMAQRLASRKRVFLEGAPSNLSEREVRKEIVYNSARERHQAR